MSSPGSRTRAHRGSGFPCRAWGAARGRHSHSCRPSTEQGSLPPRQPRALALLASGVSRHPA